MQKTMPVAVSFFVLAVVLAAGYLVKASSDRKDQQDAARNVVPEPKKVDAWKTYEDGVVKLRYPKGWEVDFMDVNIDSEQTWTVLPPDSDLDETGCVTVRKKVDGKEKRPLKKIYKETTWNADRIGQPKMLSLKGAECLHHKVESDWNDVYVEADGRTRIQRKCVKPRRKAHCYTDSGQYVSVYADQGMYCDRQNPDAKTQAYIDIYERVLRSLEFKSG